MGRGRDGLRRNCRLGGRTGEEGSLWTRQGDRGLSGKRPREGLRADLVLKLGNVTLSVGDDSASKEAISSEPVDTVRRRHKGR